MCTRRLLPIHEDDCHTCDARASALDDCHVFVTCNYEDPYRSNTLIKDRTSGGADHYQVKAGLICMQAAAQPPGCKAKMACTLNVEQAIAMMSDIDTARNRLGKMKRRRIR